MQYTYSLVSETVVKEMHQDETYVVMGSDLVRCTLSLVSLESIKPA